MKYVNSQVRTTGIEFQLVLLSQLNYFWLDICLKVVFSIQLPPLHNLHMTSSYSGALLGESQVVCRMSLIFPLILYVLHYM